MNKIMSSIKKNYKEYNMVDWIIVLGLITFCFFSYQHPDIWHTGGSSFAYLNGHIWDFYDYNKSMPDIAVNNYMPTTYIIFAIWNIPMKLLGFVSHPTMDVPIFVRLWYKGLTTLFYCGTAYIIYKTCRLLNCDKKMALFAAFLFVSNPIAIYSQFIFGQYDIITTFFITLGIYYYIKNENWKFVFAFAIAITCKYFAFLFFLPMLLYKEKNVLEIIKKCIGVGSIFVLETMFYIHSQAFKDGVFGFGATGYIFDLQLDVNHVKISIVVLVWVALCAYTYFNEQTENSINWLIFYLNLVTFFSFGLSFWHPQWLLMAVPTWVLGNVISKKRDIFMLLECLLMTFYIVFVVNGWPEALDQGLFSGAVWSAFLDTSKLSLNLKMNDLFVIKNNDLIFTCFASVLFVITIFKHPKYTQNIKNIDTEYSKGINRLRYLYGILIFVIPSIICLTYNYTQPTVVYAVNAENAEFMGGIPNEVVYEQYFETNVKKITGISVMVGTYGRVNDCDVHFELYDNEKSKLAETTVNAAHMKDCQFNKIKWNKVDVTPGEQYILKIYCTNVSEDLSNAITFEYTSSDVDTGNYLVCNQSKMMKNLVFEVYGK